MTDPAKIPPKTGSGRPAGKAAHITPMMAQYTEIKNANPGSLLFYRMGDFYELFFDDAVKAAKALDIVLTKRGKHLGEDIPMCGVPVHKAQEYLLKLNRAGYKVAVCEQVEDPSEARKRGGKSVVRREVQRLVTKGTLTEEGLLEARRNNFLAAVHILPAGSGADDNPVGLAWCDISTGEFGIRLTASTALAADLAALEASEILVAETVQADRKMRFLHETEAVITPLPASQFDSTSGQRRLQERYKVAALEAYGDFSRAELGAAGALLDYIEATQMGKMPPLQPPRRTPQGENMLIDAATRSNLELTRTLSGARKGSLLSAIDLTITGAGSRLLARRLSAPLTDPEQINARLDAVDFLAGEEALRQDVRAILKSCPDPARAFSRLALGRGGPRDLLALAGALQTGCALMKRLRQDDARLVPLPDELQSVSTIFDRCDNDLLQSLTSALADEVPLLARDGGFVRAGHRPALDETRRLRDESRKVIAGLQGKYAEATGIRTLKIKHNNVLGYFIEVTPQNSAPLMEAPLNEQFIHRQTLANAVRFSTVELSGIESQIARAAERALAMELEVFERLVGEVNDHGDHLAALAGALATLDVTAALGELAARRNFVRPKVDDSRCFAISAGRHPVVELALDRQNETFIANDCDLSPARDGNGHIWLLTGPNMAGKSTFLRQNALIAILAQMGSFVPARAAHIGIVDRLFSRVGAADDLARGRSTFMVEMVETAVILNQAGDRSLVILDEIGRGTATFDGLSIAWACVEHLHEQNACRALFATHFHELTALSQNLPHLHNATVKVREWDGEVIFLHEVTAGAADRSYGLQVARLAGLPPAVLNRAGEVLALLEKSDQRKNMDELIDDLPLFSATRPACAPVAGAHDELREAVRAALPDTMTPREALDFVYQLKNLLQDC